MAVLFLAVLANAQEEKTEQAKSKKHSAEEVAKQLADPNTTLGFLTFNLDYFTYDGDLPGSDDQEAWKLSFQPSLPYSLGEGTNFFLRPLIPIIIDQPVYENGGFSSKGVELGDIGFDAAIGHSFPSGLTLIGGLAGLLPTATDDALGLEQLLLGPEVVVGWKFKWGFLGGLFIHQWDVAGEDDYDTSITSGQLFFTVNLKHGWQIQSQPLWSYNHNATSGNKWTLPVGLAISKTSVFDKMPIKFSLQYYNYIESPDAFGPEHQVRFIVTPVVPMPW